MSASIWTLIAEERERDTKRPWDLSPIIRAAGSPDSFQEAFNKCIEDGAAEAARLEMVYGLRTVGFEPVSEDEPYKLRRVLEPIVLRSNGFYSKLSALFGEEDDRPLPTTGMMAAAFDEPKPIKMANAPAEFVEAMCARQAQAEALGPYKLSSVAKGEATALAAVTEQPRPKFRAIGSTDLCIKHGFRSTPEQRGCPKCVEDGFFLKLEQQAGTPITACETGLPSRTIISSWTGSFELATDVPYRSFIITRIFPQKRSDEPVPKWLQTDTPIFEMNQARACGCTLINGVKFPCIACAKGGV
jgi:hypothetical protein